MEAKQKVPPFLAELCSENEKYLNLGGKIFQKAFKHAIATLLFFVFQTTEVAAIAVDWVTELLIVPNLKPSKINRLRILEDEIILLTRLLIINKIIQSEHCKHNLICSWYTYIRFM